MQRFSLKRSSGKVSVLHGGEAIVLEQVEDENETMWDPIPTSELRFASPLLFASIMKPHSCSWKSEMEGGG